LARILIVGCRGRGEALARDLVAAGHAVRGTTRDPRGIPFIEAAGAEPYIGDPDRIATLMEALTGVTILAYLMGTADSDDLHDGRLRMLCEKLVDTPVRGLIYEVPGDAARGARGAAIVADAHRRWNIPVERLDTPPAQCEGWRAAATGAVDRLLGYG
jgi:uncharacterized protein YbjT (DUF2867 family)